MVFSIKELSYKEVLKLLQNCENSFNPPLSHNIPYTVDEYAKRLANNASFIVCEENDEIIGFTAFYTNIEGGFLYIPQIWVSDNHQRKGVGTGMMEYLIMKRPLQIETIRLEVRKNNVKAICFYLKSNFVSINDVGNKIIMEKKLSKSDSLVDVQH